MERAIKFRGVHENKDGSIELPCGDLVHDAPGSTAYYATHPYRICGHTERGCGWNSPIRKGTVMQFTGFLDLNEKEVYEGDILHESAEGYLPVYFDNEYGGFCVKTLYEKMDPETGTKDMEEFGVPLSQALNDMSFLEVVGNIYENPELLNK